MRALVEDLPLEYTSLLGIDGFLSSVKKSQQIMKKLYVYAQKSAQQQHQQCFLQCPQSYYILSYLEWYAHHPYQQPLSGRRQSALHTRESTTTKDMSQQIMTMCSSV